MGQKILIFIQLFLWRGHGDCFAGMDSFQFGRSVTNQVRPCCSLASVSTSSLLQVRDVIPCSAFQGVNITVGGLIQSPCGKINIDNVRGEGVLVHGDVLQLLHCQQILALVVIMHSCA